jgi:hypothetical protein
MIVQLMIILKRTYSGIDSNGIYKKEVGALNLVVYTMNHIDGDLYQEHLFPDINQSF